jgi:O-methyltransferase / aklanonic acid methyltransferase
MTQQQNIHRRLAFADRRRSSAGLTRRATVASAARYATQSRGLRAQTPRPLISVLFLLCRRPFEHCGYREPGVAKPSSATIFTMAGDARAAVGRMFDDLSSSYDAVVPVHTYFGERLVEAAGVTDGDRVLDVGTGLGACLIPAARIVGERGVVVGIDVSAEMIAKLTRSIDSAGVRNVQARLMDAQDLKFGDGEFDVVTCALVVFFFSDRVRALSELGRVLRPGGTIALSTFANDALGYPWIVDVLERFIPEDAPRPSTAQQFLQVDPNQLHAQLCEVGFESPTSEVVDGRFWFESASEHWDWLMTTGYRFAIDRIDRERIGAFKEALGQRLQAHRDENGYRFDRPMRFTVARRAHLP